MIYLSTMYDTTHAPFAGHRRTVRRTAMKNDRAVLRCTGAGMAGHCGEKAPTQPRPAFDLSASLSCSCSCVRAQRQHRTSSFPFALSSPFSPSPRVFPQHPQPSCHRAWVVSHASCGCALRCRVRVIRGAVEATLKASGGALKPIKASWAVTWAFLGATMASGNGSSAIRIPLRPSQNFWGGRLL